MYKIVSLRSSDGSVLYDYPPYKELVTTGFNSYVINYFTGRNLQGRYQGKGLLEFYQHGKLIMKSTGTWQVGQDGSSQVTGDGSLEIYRDDGSLEQNY